jgi:hypothetical protein
MLLWLIKILLKRDKYINMVRDNGELKGKINWFTRDQLIRDGIIAKDQEITNPTENELQELKAKCVKYLTELGYTFFHYIGYRVILGRTGKLKEFGVQFHHIN